MSCNPHFQTNVQQESPNVIQFGGSVATGATFMHILLSSFSWQPRDWRRPLCHPNLGQQKCFQNSKATASDESASLRLPYSLVVVLPQGTQRQPDSSESAPLPPQGWDHQISRGNSLRLITASLLLPGHPAITASLLLPGHPAVFPQWGHLFAE